ncbi:pentapeptide repeat-containing protein [Rothia mucilaginosa]|uniref:pentapeptide repeat-containing protein n=1 Tax=Rothia mucilaginosa TaxID=43675 RepID=UPI0028DB64A7|nr:pentapeptide repeat-containing protein [Rothia mucilaginosa]
MLKGDRSFQRRQGKTLPEKDATQKTQESWYQKLRNWVLADPPLYIRYFFPLLVFLGCLGGFLALTVPLWKSWAETPKTNFIESIIGWIGSVLSSFIPPSDADKYPEGKVIADVRLHILYITGGIIAILTLLQTNWKNQVDHRKVEDDIQKNKNDHNRQVHADRRTRYATAIEQLADDKLAVRLGGIYTLVGLADEWLADDSLTKDKQQEEGQVIINNLCAYIRSPFPLSLHRNLFESKSINDKKIQIYNKNFTKDNFTEDKIKFLEEQETRRIIFAEMNKRFSRIDENGLKHLGLWSSFDFNFTKSKIFYPLNNLTFENCNFAGAIFYGDANFTYSGFIGEVRFTASHFMENATFKDAYFSGDADFIGARFEETASFYGTRFAQKSKFNSTIFMGPTDFREVEFQTESPTFGISLGKLSNHALFSCNINQKYYDFNVSNSSYPIIIGHTQLGKKKFEIPIESKVFDPKSWDNKNQKYSRTSNPAQLSKKSTCTIKRIFTKIKT